MKAIRIEQFGGPEVMQVRDVDTPELQTGEVLVKNFFLGINPVDYKIREGEYPEVKQEKLPLTLGREVAGLIEKVGPGVSTFKEGDRVFGMIGADGGYAEYSRVPAEHLALIPAELDWPAAAGVPLAGHTAWQALVEHGHLEQGQKVLIHGGTGGVGHFAVQFAKVKGAEVYATASTDSLPFLQELGVDRAIDYKTERFEDICKDFDLVIDLIGGETQARSWQVLGEGGRLISTLTMPDAHHPQATGKTGARFIADPRGEELTEIAGLIAAGNVQVYIARTFELEEAAQALDFLANGHVQGKVVLRVRD
ncbi:NADP-dependent oxidoreductase [Pseudomonas sp. CDFA 602]|uniref:NADP-dependent oxidoreductase n=1 Tax=Pseudomonas californiensis TaxID=2829823 RepID=UPI001E592986|nr:NADP-dependent oxidoreductase [Pseudomonas californiensis]MCD5994943.1 NADP-dependent oxidoreductase [Pseudomonas californiensis]MCD6000426.1 NADP-dependent oxidoreductase [Pseudomonas californiensis]